MRKIINSALTAAILMSSPALAEQAKQLDAPAYDSQIISSNYKSVMDVETPYIKSSGGEHLTYEEIMNSGTGTYFDSRAEKDGKVSAIVIDVDNSYLGSGEYSRMDLKKDLRNSPFVDLDSATLKGSIEGIEHYASYARDFGGEERMMAISHLGQFGDDKLKNVNDTDFYISLATLRENYINEVFAKDMMNTTDSKYVMDIAPYILPFTYGHELEHTSIKNILHEFNLGNRLPKAPTALERKINALEIALVSEVSSDLTPLGGVYARMLEDGLRKEHLNAFADGLSLYRMDAATSVSNKAKKSMFYGSTINKYLGLSAHQSDVAVQAYTALILANFDDFKRMNVSEMSDLGREITLTLVESPEIQEAMNDRIVGTFDSMSFEDREKLASKIANEVGAKNGMKNQVSVTYPKMPEDLEHKNFLHSMGYKELSFKENIEQGPLPSSFYYADENAEMPHSLVINAPGVNVDSKLLLSMEEVSEELKRLVEDTSQAYIFNTHDDGDIVYFKLDNRDDNSAKELFNKIQQAIDVEKLQPIPLHEIALYTIPTLDYYSQANGANGEFRPTAGVMGLADNDNAVKQMLVETVFEKPELAFGLKENKPEEDLSLELEQSRGIRR